MTAQEEREMHSLAVKLAQLTSAHGWEAVRYGAIANLMDELSTYYATCDCRKKAKSAEVEAQNILLGIPHDEFVLSRVKKALKQGAVMHEFKGKAEFSVGFEHTGLFIMMKDENGTR